jgi:hypothetical protein
MGEVALSGIEMIFARLSRTAMVDSGKNFEGFKFLSSQPP